MTRYQINWDNGGHACGTFPMLFETESDAVAYGDNWIKEMAAITPDIDPDEEGYSYEVIEVETSENNDNEGDGWAPEFWC